VQASSSRLFDSDAVVEKIRSFRITYPWVCLIVLRHGGKDVEQEDFSYYCPRWVRFTVYVSGKLHNSKANEDSFNSLINMVRPKISEKLSTSASATDNDWNEKENKKKSKEKDKEQEMDTNKNIVPLRRNCLSVIRLPGAESEALDLENILCNRLSVQTISQVYDGCPVLLVIQTSGPRLFNLERIKEEICSVQKKQIPWIGLLCLRYASRDITDVEDQPEIPCPVFRLMYSSSGGILQVASNDANFATLRKVISKFSY